LEFRRVLFRSRNSTDAEATISEIPATKKVWSRIRNGTRNIVQRSTMSPWNAYASDARKRIGMASTKCTRCDATTTSGSASAGNITFLIRPAFDETELAASSTAAEKNVHGRIPAKRNSGYGCT